MKQLRKQAQKRFKCDWFNTARHNTVFWLVYLTIIYVIVAKEFQANFTGLQNKWKAKSYRDENVYLLITP